MNKFLAYIAISVIGMFAAYNMDIFPEKIQASPPKTELPAVKFEMPKQFAINIDLNNGKADLSGNTDCSIDVTVNHPTKMVESGSVKPKVIIQHETKTEYLTKTVMFPLQTPRLHMPSIEKPNRVEK